MRPTPPDNRCPTAPSTAHRVGATPTASPRRRWQMRASVIPRRGRGARSRSRRHPSSEGKMPRPSSRSGGVLRMRRLQLVPVMAITLFALAGVAHAKKFPPCPSGRFVVSPADALQFGNPPPALETLSIVGGTQVVLPDCGPAPTKLKGGKKATTLTARWAQCGTFSKIRLKAKIPSPACNTLQGTIKAKKTAAKPFTAALSTCGDGSFDGEGGEECDATASGGDAACPGACGTVGT